MRGLAAGLLLLVAAGAARAAPSEATRPTLDLPVETTITNPDWAKTPDADDMANYYPSIATAIGIGGRVVLHCTVTAAGALAACSALSETPVGMGFGDAAIVMATKFQMRPATLDGRPVEGGQINIPIRFRAPEEEAPAASPSAEQGPPPDPKALALAAHLAQLAGWDRGVAADADKYVSQLAPGAQQQGLTAQEAAAIDSMKTAAAQYAQSVLTAREAKIARSFSPEQLEKLVELFSDPTAQLWFSSMTEMGHAEAQTAAAVQARVILDARQRFCGQVACIESAGAQAPQK